MIVLMDVGEIFIQQNYILQRGIPYAFDLIAPLAVGSKLRQDTDDAVFIISIPTSELEWTLHWCAYYSAPFYYLNAILFSKKKIYMLQRKTQE